MNRRWVVCVGLVTGLLAPALAVTSASAAPGPGTPEGAVCRHVAYSGDGGYFSQTFFFWEPSDTVTVSVHWCSTGGAVTSKKVTETTTIPSSLDPRIIESDAFARGCAALKVSVSGGYNSGVLNNVGTILLAGHVAANGHHHFADYSAAQG